MNTCFLESARASWRCWQRGSWRPCSRSGSGRCAIRFCTFSFLATTLVFVSRCVGIFALVHAVFVISLPRIYMGIHYPTALVAGALIGSGAAALGKIARVRTAVVGPLLQWLRKYPGLFYACFFAASFQIATGFGPSIELARFALAVAKAVFHQLQ